MSNTQSNRFDPKTTTRFVGDIERHIETIASYTGEHMERCRDVRDLISEVYDAAVRDGIPKKELKAVVKTRALERSIEKLRDDLAEGVETFDMIRAALGDLADTPLGLAAMTFRSEGGDGPSVTIGKRRTKKARPANASADPDAAAADAAAADAAAAAYGASLDDLVGNGDADRVEGGGF